VTDNPSHLGNYVTADTITSLLAAVSAGFAVSAMICAPIAVAQSCKPDQVWLHGECTYPPDDSGGPPEPRLITEHGSAGSSTTHIVDGRPER